MANFGMPKLATSKDAKIGKFGIFEAAKNGNFQLSKIGIYLSQVQKYLLIVGMSFTLGQLQN